MKAAQASLELAAYLLLQYSHVVEVKALSQLETDPEVQVEYPIGVL